MGIVENNITSAMEINKGYNNNRNFKPLLWKRTIIEKKKKLRFEVLCVVLYRAKTWTIKATKKKKLLVIKGGALEENSKNMLKRKRNVSAKNYENGQKNQ